MPILEEDKPDSMLIHIGTNDLNNHNLYAVSPEKLASDIIEIGRTCKVFNVKEVFISSVLCRNEVILPNQINRTNKLLNVYVKKMILITFRTAISLHRVSLKMAFTYMTLVLSS